MTLAKLQITSLPSDLLSSTTMVMSDIAQHVLSLLTLSFPGESAASPPQSPPSDDYSDPQVPASAIDTLPPPSLPCPTRIQI